MREEALTSYTLTEQRLLARAERAEERAEKAEAAATRWKERLREARNAPVTDLLANPVPQKVTALSRSEIRTRENQLRVRERKLLEIAETLRSLVNDLRSELHTPEPLRIGPASVRHAVSTMEAAKALGVSDRMVVRYIHDGLLPAFQEGRVWRVDADAVAVLAERRRGDSA